MDATEPERIADLYPKELIERVKRAARISRAIGSTWHVDGSEAEDLALALEAAIARAEKAERMIVAVVEKWPLRSVTVREVGAGSWCYWVGGRDIGPLPTKLDAVLGYCGLGTASGAEIQREPNGDVPAPPPSVAKLSLMENRVGSFEDQEFAQLADEVINRMIAASDSEAGQVYDLLAPEIEKAWGANRSLAERLKGLIRERDQARAERDSAISRGSKLVSGVRLMIERGELDPRSLAADAVLAFENGASLDIAPEREGDG